jgi:hypothetical protein
MSTNAPKPFRHDHQSSNLLRAEPEALAERAISPPFTAKAVRA